MKLRIFLSIFVFVFLFASCGESTNTENDSESDRDSIAEENDDETVNDNSVKPDNDSVATDENTSDADISESCGNSSIEWPEVCDGGVIDCINIDSEKYSSGKAKCYDNCSGWNVETCEIIETEGCVNGTRQCYGAYQYQICNGNQWDTPVDCSKNGTCYGEGRCSNDCYSHDSYQCYDGNVYWYDTCGEREGIKENCGTSGYVGNRYCQDDEVYQDYKTVSCWDDYCEDNTEAQYIEYCSEGCVSGVCNAEPIYPPSTVNASDGNYDDYVYITWITVDNATDYYIYRATSSTGTYSKIDSTGGDTYYYDYPSLSNTYYYYKVTAYNATSGESEMSSYNAGWCY